jgi:hypothetical protein
MSGKTGRPSRSHLRRAKQLLVLDAAKVWEEANVTAPHEGSARLKERIAT